MSINNATRVKHVTADRITGADIKALDAFFFRVVAMANPGGTATSNYVGQ